MRTNSGNEYSVPIWLKSISVFCTAGFLFVLMSMLGRVNEAEQPRSFKGAEQYAIPVPVATAPAEPKAVRKSTRGPAVIHSTGVIEQEQAIILNTKPAQPVAQKDVSVRHLKGGIYVVESGVHRSARPCATPESADLPPQIARVRRRPESLAPMMAAALQAPDVPAKRKLFAPAAKPVKVTMNGGELEKPAATPSIQPAKEIVLPPNEALKSITEVAIDNAQPAADVAAANATVAEEKPQVLQAEVPFAKSVEPAASDDSFQLKPAAPVKAAPQLQPKNREIPPVKKRADENIELVTYQEQSQAASRRLMSDRSEPEAGTNDTFQAPASPVASQANAAPKSTTPALPATRDAGERLPAAPAVEAIEPVQTVQSPLPSTPQLPRRTVELPVVPRDRDFNSQPVVQQPVNRQQVPAGPVYGVQDRSSTQPVVRELPSRTQVQQGPYQPNGPRVTYPTARQNAQPPAAPNNANKANEDRPVFEVVDESERLELQVRRSKILRTKGNIYRTAVVDPSICDVAHFTPREVSVIGKSQGATHVTFWFEGGAKPVTFLVEVVPDPVETEKVEQEYSLLEEVIADLFPDSKVRLVVVADKLIVSGQAKDNEEAAQIMSIVRSRAIQPGGNATGIITRGGQAARVLSAEATGRPAQSQLQVINMLRVPGVHQVALRVKIAELNRTRARGFGVDLDAAIDLTSGKSSTLFLQSMLNVVNGEAPSLLTQFDGDDIQIGIRWLQQHGVLRLLSEPTLVTMSGRPATFVAGGEFAVPTVVGTAGLNAVTTDFRAFGVIISFMPTVVDKDRIRLQVSPEFSQINNQLNVNDTPGLNVRAVTTTVEMREGQTLAIAGLLEDTLQSTKVGDLPVLQKIFGRRDVSHNETELIILVTPELIHPMDPEEVPPLPGFDITEPTNLEFFLHGNIEGAPTSEYRSTVWPRLKRRYGTNGPAMISGPFGHGQ